VVAPRTQYSGIGIDAEVHGRVTEELWGEIFTNAELHRLGAFSILRRAEMATILFCAKEAFYKCQYQRTGAWLGFEGAEVMVRDRKFILRLLHNVGGLVGGQEFVGRFEALSSIVVAGIAIAVR
jgi:4'-phosphopantetheinyl transferase EntD